MKLTIGEAQTLILKNKYLKKFPIGDKVYDIGKIKEEVEELEEALLLNMPTQGEELADIIILCIGLGGGIGLNMEEEVAKKILKNSKRIITPDGKGGFNKREGDEDDGN